MKNLECQIKLRRIILIWGTRLDCRSNTMYYSRV